MIVLGIDTIVDIQLHKASLFGKEIFKLFKNIRPTKIIETGTYLGLGSTNTIATAIQSLKLKSIFYSIEVNPYHIEKAKESLGELNSFVSLVNGLSIPKEKLPTIDEIQKELISNSENDKLFVDHQEENRASLYMAETDFNYVPDDMLNTCLKKFDYCPDFVLLDSGGHVGYLEFNYLISLLKDDCYIALDDIFHVKHYKSFLQIMNNIRFPKTLILNEGTGHCITKFIKV